MKNKDGSNPLAAFGGKVAETVVSNKTV